MSDEQPPESRTPRGRPLVIAAAVCLAVCVAAFAVYRPAQNRPFHILDFAEFIPLLDGTSGWTDAASALVDYYASQGRLSVVSLALLAGKYTLLGWWTVGWQLARALLMLLIAALTYVLLRRLGGSRSGSLLGSLAFVWAPSASDGWVRLSMGEPVGAMVALVASIRAVRYQATAHWRREAVLLGLAGAVLVFTKELLAPIFLLPLMLALTVRPDGSLAAPERTPRNFGLVGIAGAVLLTALVPVAFTYFRADAAAYATLYGSAWQTPASILALWISVLIPFDPIPVPAHLVWALATLGFIGLLAAGWRLGFESQKHRVTARWLLLIALLVPLAGVVAYFPNPWYARFYSLPYLIGPAILLAMAATYLESQGAKSRRWVLFASLPMAAHAIGAAAELASRTDAVQRRDDAIVALVARAAGADSVLFSTSRPPPEQWLATADSMAAPRGMGATLNRFAAATHRPWPRTYDVSCQRGQSAVDMNSNAITVNLESSCTLESPRKHAVVFRYRRVDWRRFAFVVDSAHGHVITPATSRLPP